MKKILVLALLAGAIALLGCPGKKKGMTAGPGCDCFNATNDTNDICTSFIDGRCGWCADKTCEMGDFCSYLPRDVDFKQKENGYSTFLPQCQNAFDWFSWQSFIALNWPADANGNPLKIPFNQQPNAPRVWESFLTLAEEYDGIAHNNSGFMILGQNTKAGPHLFDGDIDDLEPGADKPLIDRNLNFALYEVRVNKTHADYIQKHGLTTWCGQKRFYDSVSRVIQFPSGSYGSDSVGAIELKTAWKVLVPGVDDTTRFFTRKAIIVVPKEYVVTKVEIRDTVTVGLVGMHLVRNVSNKGGEWIWSSFEQIDNSPECPNGNCPTDSAKYSFYNRACSTCTLNKAPSADKNKFLWSVGKGLTKQYGRQYAFAGFGSQIGRINPVEQSTDSISRLWQKKLAGMGSVWQYYRLIGSQWLNAEDSHGQTSTIGIPTAQANTAMGSYLQVVKPKTGSGSCMSCHGFANGSYNKLNANLSFTLGYPPADSNCNTVKKPK